MPRTNGIFCIETSHWDDGVPKQPSLEHLLGLIESTQGTPYIHRDFSTKEELEFLLTEATLRKYDDYPIIYLASHGGDREIVVRRKARKKLVSDTVTLEDIAKPLEGRGRDKIFIFGACSIMKADKRHLSRFVHRTNVKAVMGYRREVDWIESAQFELGLLAALARRSTKNLNSIAAAIRELRSNRDLMKNLEFRMVPAASR